MKVIQVEDSSRMPNSDRKDEDYLHTFRNIRVKKKICSHILSFQDYL